MTITDPMSANVRALRTYLDSPETKSRDATDRQGAVLSSNSSLSVAFRHSGWARERRLIVESLHRTEQPQSRIEQFATCGQQSYVLRSLDDPTNYRIAGSSCHDRFCLPCANDRSQTIALNVCDQIKGKRVRFLTLTLKASLLPLRQQLDRLYDSFQTLRRRKFWQQAVAGGVAFLELKWNAHNDHWHPHFHMLIQGNFLPYQQLRAAWLEITGDSYIVDIRIVKDEKQATCYVTKYASKPFNSSYVNRPGRLDEAITGLKARRLVITFGTWRGVILTRHVSDTAWEHVAPLETIITRAANGDNESRVILAALTDRDLSGLYARAPPPPPEPRPAPPSVTQLTFFGTWNRNGSYRYSPGLC